MNQEQFDRKFKTLVNAYSDRLDRYTLSGCECNAEEMTDERFGRDCDPLADEVAQYFFQAFELSCEGCIDDLNLIAQRS